MESQRYHLFKFFIRFNRIPSHISNCHLLQKKSKHISERNLACFCDYNWCWILSLASFSQSTPNIFTPVITNLNCYQYPRVTRLAKTCNVNSRRNMHIHVTKELEIIQIDTLPSSVSLDTSFRSSWYQENTENILVTEFSQNMNTNSSPKCVCGYKAI